MKKFVFLLLLNSCCLLPSYKVDKAFDYEYGTKDRERQVLVSGPSLILPRWLIREDYNQTIDSINKSIENLKIQYSRSSEVDWSKIVILIHDNLDWCMSRFHKKVSGFHDETGLIIITWQPTTEGYPRVNKPFSDLIPHELFHLIFHALYNNGDEKHAIYFPDVQEIITKVTKEASSIVLSDQSKQNAKNFKYTPWTESLD